MVASLGVPRVISLILVFLVLAAPALAQKPSGGWELVVLGIAQDGGMPHPGCAKSPCTDVHAGTRRAEKVSCLGLVDRESGAAYLFDATPDFPAQLQALTGGQPPDGIFLTHAHIGHYTGLMYLGKESMAAKSVPVYGTARMTSFLETNGPWSLLVKEKYIEPHVLTPEVAVELPGGVRVTPMLVPHRDEFTDTVGYLIEGPRAKALFIPDIDKWEKWDRSLRELADKVDVLLVDGTFASMDELPGRDITQVPHPLMSETRALLAGARAKLWFIHLNHSNPAIVGRADVAREGTRFPL
ncbi:MAG: MBL fold metallo-hydrolase [Candidatus Latescibacteria bacterium]|nr:MBL fold metallo-hydrolase [Candidatus Latescibacterota bacterium]